MRQPPPLSQLPKFPITAGVALLAVAVTGASALGWNIEPLVMNAVLLPSQPWRLLTSTLPHGGIFHLLFNVYWLWVFGTALERFLGPFKFLAIVILLAAASSAAEFALFHGGIGLSGVGYGLFGMLCILGPRKSQLADTIDSRTTLLFIAWFFLCILTTAMGWFPVANAAHGAGLVLGLLVGWFLTATPKKRPLALASILAALALITLGSTVARTTVNFSAYAGQDYADVGLNLIDSAPAKALPYYHKALAFRYTQARDWYNAAVALHRLGRIQESLPYLEQAAQREPHNEQFSIVFQQTRDYLNSSAENAASQRAP